MKIFNSKENRCLSLFIIVAVGSLLLTVCGFADAAVSISLTGSDWPIEDSQPASVATSGSSQWEITNSGDDKADITIGAGASTPTGWTAGTETGNNIFVLELKTPSCVDASGDCASDGEIITSDTSLAQGLETGGTAAFGLSFTTPTSGSEGEGEQQSISVTLTAAAWVFSCGNTFTDPRDSQPYSTVQIGDQCWFAENLNYSSANSWCYDDDAGNCDTYGGLYNWDDVMCGSTTDGAQGICPNGWHVPTDEEYKTLEMELGMSQAEADDTGYRGINEGSALAGNTDLWDDGTLKSGARFGESDFTALPAGYRNTDGNFFDLGSYSDFWSSTEDATHAWKRILASDNSTVYRLTGNKDYGFSVRCLRD